MKNTVSWNDTMQLTHLGIHYGLVHEALLKGKRGWALRFARPLLNQGDASTQWYVGLMHHTGSGVKKDLAVARRWYEKSAARGFGMARDALEIIDSAERNEEVNAKALRCPSMHLVYQDSTWLTDLLISKNLR
jgi:TPR repeat protein